MFETATLSYGPRSKRFWTTAMGFTGQAVLIGCLVVTPMVFPQTMGRALLVTMLVTPSVPTAPTAPGPQVVPQTHHATVAPGTHKLVTPSLTNMPPVARTIIDDPPDVGPVGQPCNNCVVGGEDPRGRGDNSRPFPSFLAVAPVVRPPQPIEHTSVVPPTTVKPVRITVVRPATPIFRVEPIYPQIAKAARVQGVVELLGVLGTDGRIHELKVLRGHPMLVRAALEAVQQWVYAPTLLNGQAVEVSAPITVTFILR